MSCRYEQIRLKNLEDNRRVLAELGAKCDLGPLPRIIKKKLVKRKTATLLGTCKRLAVVDLWSAGGPVRRSGRLQGQELPVKTQLPEDVKYCTGRKENFVHRPNLYGAVKDVEVGTLWQTRVECSHDGIHRPTVAGIHGNEREGAYSIALSGGYEDDLDFGEFFTYTGEGGRDLKGTKSKPKNLRTAPQSRDQLLARGNLALSLNVQNGNPVRVIRGYKLNSPFAPDEGYRYDGLYAVEKCWYTTGLAGYMVWKFALRRLNDQSPPPWKLLEVDSSAAVKIDNIDKAQESDTDSGIDSDSSSQVGKDKTKI